MSDSRPDFEFDCECGYYLCTECEKPWYPMEIENEQECPECLGGVKFVPPTKKEPAHYRACAQCGVQFVPLGRWDTLCSDQCKIQAHGGQS